MMKRALFLLIAVLMLSAPVLTACSTVNDPLAGLQTAVAAVWSPGTAEDAAPPPMLRFELSPAGDEYTAADLQAARFVIEQRLLILGLAAPVVQVVDDAALRVEVSAAPGGSSPERLASLLTTTGLLELVDFSGIDGMALQDEIILTTEQAARDLRFAGDALLHPMTGEPFTTVMTGEAFAASQAAYQENFGQWVIEFEVAPDYVSVFADYTASHIGQPLGIVLDGRVLSAPIIQMQLSSSGLISGNFTQEEAEDLAIQLTAGALPLPLQIDSVESLPGDSS